MKKQLKDICETITKGTTPTTLGYNYQETGINFVKIESINSYGMFEPEKFAHISDDCNVALRRSQLKENDILFSIAGAIGRTAIVNKSILPANTNQALAIIRLNNSEEYNLKFLRYQLASEVVLRQTERQKQGVAQLNLSLKDIGNLELSLPSLSDQQKIATELDTILSAIDNKKQQLSLLDEAVKSEFVEMFGENPVESGKWKVEKIASVVDKNILSVKKKFQKTDTIKYVDISAIDNISNVVTGFTEYVLLEAPSRAQQVINQNDILISTVRPNLRNIAINPFNDNFMVGSSGFCVLRVNDLCNAKYLFYCVLNDDFTNAMVDLTTGAAYPAIKESDILAYPIALPPLDLQKQFAAFVQQIDKSKFVVKKQIADLQELFDSKMQEYFGE